jgi:YHS domain-containing protein
VAQRRRKGVAAAVRRKQLLRVAVVKQRRRVAAAVRKRTPNPQPAERAAAPSDKLICPVSGEELDEATAVRFTYNGKVYYTCCNGCKSKFLKDPETYAKKAEEISKLQGKPEKADTN